ncbi:MAG: DUF89 family protein [Candidatus Aminicenantes bacterium]|nr:MAG: DUF89 family protein [Candidatus Aminicenantes bacterium]
MRTYLDCYPCFFHQIIGTSRMMNVDEQTIRDILVAFGQSLPRIHAEAIPPEIGREAYRLISEKTGILDPYAKLKKECTQQALSFYPKLKERVASSQDRLLEAVRIAIAGNVIDFGANADFDLDKDLAVLLSQPLAINHYRAFCHVLKRARKILFIADNAGETVFDRILIEELEKQVVYAVREKPIINDALYQDALDAGIDKIAEIVSSGTDAPGTILNLCSDHFLEIYRSVDLIISKGQGNYEGLSDETRPVFFLLKAKCAVIARDIGVKQGGLILMKAKNYDFPVRENPIPIEEVSCE